MKAGLLTVFIENAQFPRILSRDCELTAKELKYRLCLQNRNGVECACRAVACGMQRHTHSVAISKTSPVLQFFCSELSISAQNTRKLGIFNENGE